MRLTPWVRVAVSAAAACLLLWRFPTGALWAAFRGFDTWQLLLALSCVLAMVAVRAYKWYYLLAESVPGTHLRDAFKSLFGGFALSVVIPGRLGELGRCLFFSGEPHRLRVALLNILDRALDGWALATWAVASLFLLVPRPAAIFGLGVWLATLPVVVGLPTLISTLGTLPWWPESLHAQGAGAASALRRIRVLRFALLSLASTSLDLMLLFFLLRSFHQVEFAIAWATFPWMVMAGSVPVSLNGLGLREGAAALLLTRYGVSPAEAVDVALLFFVFNALLPAVVGGVWLLADRQKPVRSCAEDLVAMLAAAWKSPARPRSGALLPPTSAALPK